MPSSGSRPVAIETLSHLAEDFAKNMNKILKLDKKV
jgi:hypothetical protein